MIADPRAEAGRLLHVVGRVDDREAPAVEVLEVVEDRVPRLRVDADRGLVAEEELRPVKERRGQVQAPLHAAGEVLHDVPPAVGELDGLERVVDPLAELLPTEAVELAEDPQVSLRAQVRVEGDVLRHEAERLPARRRSRRQPRPRRR